MTTATEEALFDTTAYQIDGLDRKASILKATLRIDYPLDHPIAQWVEGLKLGNQIAGYVTGQVLAVNTGYEGSDEGEHANKTTIIRLDSIEPQ